MPLTYTKNQQQSANTCYQAAVTQVILQRTYSLAYRLLRICSNQEQFELRLSELKSDLISRRYKGKIIDDAFNRVRLVPREEALKKVQKRSNDRPVMVMTYHPGLPSVAKILKKHHSVMVSQSKILARAFPKPSIVAYRRPKNLKDIFCKAKVSSRRTSRRLKNGYRPCGQGCMLCWSSPRTSTHMNLRTKEVWDINAPLDCNSKDVVYKNACKKCPFWGPYIGETGRRLRDRAQEHRGYINQKVNNEIGSHFNLPGHSVADLVVTAIEKVHPSRDNKNIDQLRKIRESYWIEKYDAVELGANTRI